MAIIAKTFTVTLEGDGHFRTRPPSDTTAPSVPVISSAVAQNSASILWTWQPSTDSQTGVAGYRLRLDGVDLQTSYAAGAVDTTLTTYLGTGFAASSSHGLQVAAVDTAGNVSAYSSAANAVTTGTSTGTVIVLHEDDFGDAKMRSNYIGTPGFGGSVPQTGADYVGTSNPRWQVSSVGDLCYNRDALIYTSTAHVRSPAYVTRSARCQLTLDRASDNNGKIERNEIIPEAYLGGGNPTMLRGNEYWFAFSVWLPSSAEGADEWIGSDVYAIIFQMKAPEFGGAGIDPGLKGPHFTLSPDYGYKPSEGGVATGWRVVVKGYTGTTLGTGSWVRYETNIGAFASDKGKWTDFIFRVCPEYRNTYVDANGVTQYATTEIWKDDVKVVSRIGFSNCVYNAAGDAYAPKFGIYSGYANASYTTGPAMKMVHYRAEWKLLQAIGNYSGTPCDTSNFAYQAVKPRGLRSSGT